MPTVVGASTGVGKAPQDGASRVAGNANVEATFSEDMDPSTINTSTFTLKMQNSTTPLGAAVSYDPSTKMATLDPTDPLQDNTTYTATVKGGAEGAKDMAGNALSSDVSWSFATSDTIPPETTISSPRLTTVPRLPSASLLRRRTRPLSAASMVLPSQAVLRHRPTLI